MGKVVETGMLRGRPFGGVMTLISNELRQITETIVCDERYATVKIANFLIINIYLPSQDTADPFSICDGLLHDVCSWCDRYSECNCIVAGYFNCNFHSDAPVAQRLTSFIEVPLNVVINYL